MLRVMATEEQQVSGIQDRLLAWFERNRRDFPWRHTDNPYVVLVTEKLLQQTAAREPVVRAFDDLTTLYPSVSALADADDADIAKENRVYINKEQYFDNVSRGDVELPDRWVPGTGQVA